VAAASATYPAGSMNMIAPGSQIAVNKSGYLYIWVSNETSGWNVYFDNLSVQYKQGPLLEENHYYPFGLTMAGISDKAIKTSYVENKFRYNEGTELQNKEFSDGTGLELYDAGFRRLDPQLGRFTQIDPIADGAEFSSAYVYAGNNPIVANDPSGLLAQNPQWMAAYNVLMNRVSGGGGGGADIEEDFEAADDAFNYSQAVSTLGPTGAFDQMCAAQMASITPNLLQLFPEAPYIEPGFQGSSMGTDLFGNSVLRMQYNYGSFGGNASTGGVAHVVVNTISLESLGDNGLTGGLSPISFNFRNTLSNWQEAAVRNIKLQVRFIGGARAGQGLNVIVKNALYFGLPLERANGDVYSNSYAAKIAAGAVNLAVFVTTEEFQDNESLSRDQIQSLFIDNIRAVMLTYGGTLSKDTRSPGVAISNAEYTWF